MRTAARIALVLTGTMIVFAATAMVGARADGRTDGGNLRVTDQTEASNLPRPQPAPRPEALPDYAHAELFAALSKIARFFEFVEMPRHAARKNNRSVVFMSERDTLRLQPVHNPAGGRRRLADDVFAANEPCDNCMSGGIPAHEVRHLANAEDKPLHQQRREHSPVMIKFEGVVININVASLGW